MEIHISLSISVKEEFLKAAQAKSVNTFWSY